MLRNRYYKSTFGTSGEFIVAKTLDVSAMPVDPINPTSATVSVTVAGTPTTGDIINLVVKGVTYSYVVKATDTTAATLVASIVTDFNNSNNVGLVASVSGTTSAVFTIAAPANSGTAWNGVVVSGAAGEVNAGPTFSAFSKTDFGTNGVDGVEDGPAATLANFVDNAPANTLGIYWDDTKKAVAPGATSLYANARRKFFYAWKTAQGNTKTTSPITAGSREYRSIPYFAGQVDVWTITVTGTVTAGQLIHIKIIDTTAANIPNPNWEYVVTSSGTIATDLTALAALINAEQQEPVASAGASGGVLTITGLFNSRQIKVGYLLEPVGSPTTNIGTDQTSVAFAQTQKSIAEVGTTADVKEFEDYMKYQMGIMKYVREGYTADELNNYTTSVDGSTQYGYIQVSSFKEETHKSSAVTNMKNRHWIFIAIASNQLNAIAGY